MGARLRWSAHYALALEQGFSAEMARAVAEGRRPEGMVAEEEILYDFCMELQRNHSVSDTTYERALDRFGEQGVIEVVGLVGYYTTLSMISNTLRAPLPAGAKPALGRFPYSISYPRRARYCGIAGTTPAVASFARAAGLVKNSMSSRATPTFALPAKMPAE